MSDTRRSQSSLATLFADNTSGDISAQDGRDVIISAHPEQVVQTGAYASEPSSGQLTGDLYLPNDSIYLERYSGSAWTPWGPIFPLTKPVDGDFAWVNQGGATIDTTHGGIYLTAPASGRSQRIRKKAAPSTPYTISAAFLFDSLAVNYHEVGLVFRASASGKLTGITLQSSSGQWILAASKFDSATVFNSTYLTASLNFPLSWPVWFRIADNGTNRILSYSIDGQHWIAFHTIGRTDFLTADEVGFFADGDGATDFNILLLSWKEG